MINFSVSLFFCLVVPENKNLFDTIHDSVLVLCLDDKYPSTDNKNKQTLIGLNFLHGCGTNVNTANRWFDKTLQVNENRKISIIVITFFSCLKLIVGPDGYSGINYVHSMAEGGMITALVDYSLDYWYELSFLSKFFVILKFFLLIVKLQAD